MVWAPHHVELEHGLQKVLTDLGGGAFECLLHRGPVGVGSAANDAGGASLANATNGFKGFAVAKVDVMDGLPLATIA